jgi:hypothetical protein
MQGVSSTTLAGCLHEGCWHLVTAAWRGVLIGWVAQCAQRQKLASTGQLLLSNMLRALAMVTAPLVAPNQHPSGKNGVFQG